MSSESTRLAARIARRGPLESVYGFGNPFAKTLRDSRRAVLGVGIGVGLLMFFTASQISIQFPTVAERRSLAFEMGQLPAMIRGLLGEPINADRLGGFISWRNTNFLPIIVGLWSILALSGTLAGEARRGSLDLLATTPVSRARLAGGKALAHVAGMAIAVLVLAGFVTAAGLAFARLPGDPISPLDGISHFVGTGLVSLTAGGIAFVLAPFLGRSAAAGVAAVALVAAYLINSYASVLPSLHSVEAFSWLRWAAGHRPLAGVSDPGSLVAVGVLDAVLLAAGVVAFVRRDISPAAGLPAMSLPGTRLGLRDAASRSFAERLPAALGWGVGIGLYGLVIAASASGFAEAFGQIQGIDRLIEQFYPGIDYRSASGVLQLAFHPFAVLLAGLAVAVLVSGWASDERDKRLDIVLSRPISRLRWALASGGGLLVAIAFMAVIAAVLVGIGAAMEGDDAGRPFVGALVIGLYGAAIAGVGVAFGGLIGPGLAAAVTAGLALAFYLLDLLGPALRLPDGLLALSLSKHLGQPIIDTFDVAGMILCAVLAVGGVVIAAWGLSRRDLRG